MSKLVSNYRAVANFTGYTEEEGINHLSKHKFKFPFNGFGLCFLSPYQLIRKPTLANTNLIGQILLLYIYISAH